MVTISGIQVGTLTMWELAGIQSRNISWYIIHMSLTGCKYGKIAIYRPWTFFRGIPATAYDRYCVHRKNCLNNIKIVDRIRARYDSTNIYFSGIHLNKLSNEI